MSRLVIIKKALANEDVRRLIDNFFSLAVLKIFNLILPFVTLPYLIKTLGFEKYGAVVLALALMQYFQAITDYGFNLSATRDVARHRHSQRQLSYIYSKVMAAKLALLIISLGLALLVILLVPQFQKDKVVFLLMLPVLLGHTLLPEWFFRGVEKMRYITILDLTIKLSFTAGVFAFIHNPEDYWIYPLLNGVGYCVVTLVAHFLVRTNFSVRYIAIGSKQIKATLKSGFPLFVNQFAPNLYNSTTSLVVGLALGNHAAGVFGAIRRIVDFLSVFNSVVSTVFFPYLNRNHRKFKSFSFYYLFLFFWMAMFFLAVHKLIFGYLGIVEASASMVFTVLVLGMLFIVVYSVYATNYLIVHGHDGLVMKITLLVSISVFFMVYPLITNLGLIGAALSVFLAQFLMGFCAYIFFLKNSKVI